MLSTALPSAADDYAAPSQMPLSKAVWDAVFNSIGERLRALEAVRASFQALIDAGTGQALEVIQANIGPQLAALQAQIAAAQASLITAQGKIDAIINSPSIPATAITFAPTGSVSSETVQAAIAEVASEVNAAIAAKADASALASAIATLNAAIVGAAKTQSVVAVSANTTLVVGNAYRIAGGVSITLTLPAAPAAGDTIRIMDGGVVSPSNQPILARNGKTIMGLASDLTIDAVGADFLIWWSGSDWRLF